MSLDLYLECPCCRRSQHESFNITHNVHRMSVEAGVDPWEWEGCTALSVVLDLDRAIEALHANPEHFRQWEPANKWGTVELLREFLGRIRVFIARTGVETPERMQWKWRVSR